MKKVTGNEDFSTPIILLMMFSMMLALELREIVQNMQSGDSSILLPNSAIFTGDILETIARICWFSVPLIIGVAAMKEKNAYLKISYFIGFLPLILTKPIIEKIGYSPLYAIKSILVFITIMCLMFYLNKTASLYKKALKDNTR